MPWFDHSYNEETSVFLEQGLLWAGQWAGLKLVVILLPQLFGHWGYRCESPWLAEVKSVSKLTWWQCWLIMCEAFGFIPSTGKQTSKQTNKTQMIDRFSHPMSQHPYQMPVRLFWSKHQVQEGLSAVSLWQEQMAFKTPFTASWLSHHTCFIKSQIIPGFLNHSLDSSKVKKLNCFKLYKTFSSFPAFYSHPGAHVASTHCEGGCSKGCGSLSRKPADGQSAVTVDSIAVMSWLAERPGPTTAYSTGHCAASGMLWCLLAFQQFLPGLT